MPGIAVMTMLVAAVWADRASLKVRDSVRGRAIVAPSAGVEATIFACAEAGDGAKTAAKTTEAAANDRTERIAMRPFR